MSYVDGFLIAVAEGRKQDFIDHARAADPIFIEMGATRIVETWEDDVPDGARTDFRRAVALEPGERVVFSWIEWPDKATRDACMARIMAPDFSDPRMAGPMPFDGARMVFGGFNPVFELTA